MAESPSSALPGGVEWLPAFGGAHLLRAELGRGEPPTLILQAADGTEHRIDPGPEARFSRATDYLVPTGVRWSVALFAWPDGTRALLPNPPIGERAQVIPMPRRSSGPVRPPGPNTQSSSNEPAAVAAAHWTAPPPGLADPGAPPAEPETTPAPPRVASASAPPDAAGDLGLASPAPATTDGLAPRAPATTDGLAPPAPAATDGLAPPAPAAAGGLASPGPATTTGLASPAPAATDGLASLARTATSPPAATSPATAPPGVAEPAAIAAPSPRVAGPPAPDVAGPPEGERFTIDQAAKGWHQRRAALEQDLMRAAEALLRAQESERATGDAALAVLAGAHADLQAVRAARAADAALLAALTAQLEAERKARERLRADLERARGETAALRAHARPAPRDLKHLASAQLEAAAAAARRPRDESSRLIAALDAAASSLRATTPPPDPTTALPAEPVAATDERPRPAADPQPTGSSLIVPDVPRPGLLKALAALAREDTITAGALLAGLLPAQGALLSTDVSYDLTVRGYGTFAVTVSDGETQVERIYERRPRKQAAFHLAGEAHAIAGVLAGEAHTVRRFRHGELKVNRRRKRLDALTPLIEAQLSLADAIRAGARFEPRLVYKALPFAVAPEWTKGHVFTVAQEIVGHTSAWYVTARDGVPLTVVEHSAGCAADARVTMSRAAFERLLKNEPAKAGDLPIVRGNRHAVAALKRWTELAAGA